MRYFEELAHVLGVLLHGFLCVAQRLSRQRPVNIGKPLRQVHSAKFAFPFKTMVI